MLLIPDRALDSATLGTLRALQGSVNAGINYATKVQLAAEKWPARNNTVRGQAAFRTIRSTLSQMCIGSIRCAYCEDSMADEIEHIYPKNLFPQLTFEWGNYAFACGPCNGPKSNRYGVIRRGQIIEFVRKPGGRIVRPPAGASALIDPRQEDPTAFLELDLGGIAQDGTPLTATFEWMARSSLNPPDLARANFTIDVLGLNREVVREARSNAFGGFRARLYEYALKKEVGAVARQLEMLKEDLLHTPHLSVFFEMRRQRTSLPEIDNLLMRAPEAATWNLTPP